MVLFLCGFVFSGKASLRIAALLELNSMYSFEAIQPCGVAANRQVVSSVSAMRAAFSASGIRRLQECIKTSMGLSGEEGDQQHS